MSNRNRRVNLALKWHYLDNLSAEEIRDRFEREGIADLTTSTIRNYLNEKPKEEVIQAIEEENANVRLQAAERFERLYQQAIEDHDELAVDDEPVFAMVPQMEVNEGETDLRVSDWEQLDPDDDRWPEWAGERDIPIAFTDDPRHIEPGEEFPVGAKRGRRPEYRKAVVGLQRDQPDRVGRSYARQEAASHMREKADVLGIYEMDINLNTDLEGALLESLKGAYEDDDE
ncbi:hypothetical protein DJ71_18495 [Halorubrum sp. E3]|nr:hypothetical protein DJ71_18495 [Halorubrum sp. E3]